MNTLAAIDLVAVRAALKAAYEVAVESVVDFVTADILPVFFVALTALVMIGITISWVLQAVRGGKR